MIEPPKFDPVPPRAVTIGTVPLLIFVLGAILVVGGVGFVAGLAAASASSEFQLRQKFGAFAEAWDIVDSEFYYPKPAPEERLRGAINGMIGTLNDRYTLLIEPQAAAADAAVMGGESGGIGAKVRTDEAGNTVIAEVLLGKPAFEAGLQSGDVLLSVNGQSVLGLDSTKVVQSIRGAIGTSVQLTVQRGADQKSFSIVRQQINVYGRMLPGKVGYVSLGLFDRKAADQITAAIQPLLDGGATALIFDLRGNPGGLLDQAVAVSDLFLKSGLIVQEKNTDGSKKEFNARDGQLAEAIPLVVLVDGGSASASEIVAGALKDRQRATLIGQTTYGKGSVQSLQILSDGSQLRVTSAAWYTPKDTPITGVGLAVNLWVTTPDVYAPGTDPILDAALGYLQGGLPPTF